MRPPHRAGAGHRWCSPGCSRTRSMRCTMRTSIICRTSGGRIAAGSISRRDEPDYWDFVYFSFTLGMTFQTCDVDITSRAGPARRDRSLPGGVRVQPRRAGLHDQFDRGRLSLAVSPSLGLDARRRPHQQQGSLPMIRRAALALLLATTARTVAVAQANNSKPQPVPFDRHDPGRRRHALSRHDDARRRCDRHRARHLPRQADDPGRRRRAMVLLYPKWLPGKHAPRGEIEKLAGLTSPPAASRSPWTRDPVDVFAFHIDVPAGREVARGRLPVRRRDQGRPGPHRHDAATC